MDIEQEILQIKQRNQKVEMDKKWELSWVRRGFILVVTYVIAAVWLMDIREPHLWWKATIPAVGYLLSTLTLPPLKKWWFKQF